MITEPKWLVRLIECFDKKTEELVSEAVLPRIDLKLLQQQWNLPADEPMVGVFDIDEGQANFLIQIDPELKFDFEKYDYQISAITADLEQSTADGGFMGEYPPPKILSTFPDLKRVKSK